MGFDLKRREGELLMISHSLFPEPTDGARYVRTFLYDQSYSPITPAFVNLTDQGMGNFLNQTITMPAGVEKIYARSEVFLDKEYTQVDEFFPGDTDIYELLNEVLLENINTNVNSLVSEGLPGETLDGFIDDDDSTLVGYIEC